MLRRIALWSVLHRKVVVVSWVVLAVVALAFGSSLAGETANGTMPKSDAEQAQRLLEKAFPDARGDTASLVVADSAGIRRRQNDVDNAIKQLKAIPGVSAVSDPWSDPQGLSPDGTVGLANITFRDGPVADETIRAIIKVRVRLAGRAESTRVGLSGYWFSANEMPTSEIIGVGAAMVILLIAFGSFVAMGLPIITALLSLAIALTGVGLWANVTTVPGFASQVAAMIGLGVGIDYALLIVSRYRQALARTGSVHVAIEEAMTTSGRAVVLAGGTVIVSLLGMLFIGMDIMRGLGIASASTVVVSVGAAVTLLPALLALIGTRIEKFSVHRTTGRRASKASGKHSLLSPVNAAQVNVPQANAGDSRFWTRWSRGIQRRPRIAAGLCLSALLAMSAPIVSMRLASADEGNGSPDSPTRIAYEEVSKGFGAGVNGPLVVAVPATKTKNLEALESALKVSPGVAQVIGPDIAANGSSAFTVIPKGGPQSQESRRLVHYLRDEVIPANAPGSHVGGQTASDVDFSDLMSSRLPVFIGAVLLASFVLLLLVFRSLLVPLKAVLMNLASIGAAYGLMVAVFQWGWFGLATPGPIEPWAPMMLFAIVFGLSMDYEVFLLAAIKERFDVTGDASGSVAEGLAATARIITAAAGIMVFVFGSFVVADDRALKLIGFGLATAVIIDATIVRLILVPATMELLGNRNWWLPKPLQRILPRLRSLEHVS
jgi:putative drug exporter of the RND superfamily